ncbi:MAG: EamA family transporter [Chloroflexi bacterium]|nr:EamA family transporter [Chloroflexota bacterium]
MFTSPVYNNKSLTIKHKICMSQKSNFAKSNPQLTAILQAFLVTILWSTSWVLIKIGLEDIPALTFAGLRYFLAFLVLLPFYLRSPRTIALRSLSRRDWKILAGLGLLNYTLTQGSQFLGLDYLPAITFSLLLNFTAPLVALLGIPLLKERPTWLQWGGISVFLIGVLVYFYPVVIPAAMLLGYAIAGVHILSTSLSSVVGRYVNREKSLDALTVTVISMGIGSVILLLTGLTTEGLPQLSMANWFNVIWLAVVNTAIAFTLFNHTLRTLSAAQSSIINNTMLIQIAILAWLFLGETINLQEGVGLAIAAAGALLVNIRSGGRK